MVEEEAASESSEVSDWDSPVILQGSVLASYLSDPVVHPAARSLFLNEYGSPRPRAADFVCTTRHSPMRDLPKDHQTPSTDTFLDVVAGLSEVYECCPVVRVSIFRNSCRHAYGTRDKQAQILIDTECRDTIRRL